MRYAVTYAHLKVNENILKLYSLYVTVGSKLASTYGFDAFEIKPTSSKKRTNA